MTPERWRQVTELFHAALSRDAASRAAFLDGACADDGELRREVDAMLAGHQEAGAFGDRPLRASTIEGRRLAAGAVVGPYRIDTLIGAGGMGEVYRARDARIGRDVAIKVLPAEYASDTERLRRFEQEVRASGALNHPNVLTLYDVGTTDGQPYLVMELLDGETLRDRINRGAMPPPRACEIAADIARGLAAAHAKGIIHRDLKPENVMLTRDGRVKILDFGIAKLRAPDAGPDERTLTTPLHTTPDTVLGTAGYMAPEQVRGLPADERADLFALGAILFELLTGRRAFDRASRVETLNAILHDDPPALNAASTPVPVVVDRILRRCLEKDPDARFQSARDLSFALETIGRTEAAASQGTAVPGRKGGVLRTGAIAVVVGAIVAIAIWKLMPRAAPQEREVTRFIVQPPPARPIASVRMDISPDGRLLVYRGLDSGVPRLFLRRLDQFDAVALPGTEGTGMPFFSPDGQWVGFFSDRRLKKVSVTATGPPTVLLEEPLHLDASWPTADTIFFGTIERGLRRISPEGGQPTVVTTPDPARHELDHHTPRLLPGGRSLLFTSHEGAEVFRVMVQALDTGTRKVLIDAGFDARYLPTGHLIYANGSSLYAVPFDVERTQVTGAAVRMIEDVATISDSGVGAFALSRTGTLVYAPASPRTGRRLVWVDRTGTETALPITPRSFRSPRLSPDDRRIAVVVADGDREDIWVQELLNDTLTRRTYEGQNRGPVWTGDGQRLAYTTLRDAMQHLTSQLAAGGGLETLVSSRNNLIAGAWTPDGQSLVYVDSPPTDLSVISVVTRDGGWRSRPLVTQRMADSPTLSPDGRWVAFALSDGGPPQIVVQPYPGPGPRHQLTTDGGDAPVWSRVGNEVFYSVGGAMYAVPVDTSHGFTSGKPVRLFDGPYVFTEPGLAGFDVSRDGRRFLMVKRGEAEVAPRQFRVVLNWADELMRRVPVK